MGRVAMYTVMVSEGFVSQDTMAIDISPTRTHHFLYEHSGHRLCLVDKIMSPC
jgi:hypothetical protein